MRSHYVFGVAAALLVATTATVVSAQDYRPAYIYAQRCFAVTSSYRDNAGARRSFDAAMKAGHALNLSNRQLNQDFETWGATEQAKTIRDPRYKAQLIAECRKLGLAS